MGLLPWTVLIAALLLFLWLDLHYFARGREPAFREGAIWSIGWLAISLLAAVVLLSFVPGIGDHPMALVFNGYELVAVLLAILVANFVVNEGESTWFEGLQLLALYALMGVVFYYA